MLKIGVTYKSTEETLANLGSRQTAKTETGVPGASTDGKPPRRPRWMRAHPCRRVGRGGPAVTNTREPDPNRRSLVALRIQNQMKIDLLAEFVKVARLEEVSPGKGIPLIDKNIAIFNVDGKICAVPMSVRIRAARWVTEGSTAPS